MKNLFDAVMCKDDDCHVTSWLHTPNQIFKCGRNMPTCNENI